MAKSSSPLSYGIIELQMISKIITTKDRNELLSLLEFDESYYSAAKDEISFIQEHFRRTGKAPDPVTFYGHFPDWNLVDVTEPISYLQAGIRANKSRIILLNTFNKVKDFDDINDAWEFIRMNYDDASALNPSKPMDIVHEGKKRAQQVADYAKQARIPTGFDEIDKLMYGGLSTVEELLIILARTNTGKSWVCTKMMESAQRNGFPVLYYSPEMQSSFLATRFDTWRTHIKNSQLFQGHYTAEYTQYLDDLEKEQTSAYILEDKDAADGEVDVPLLKRFVEKYNIKLLIVDGLSYVVDSRSKYSDRDHEKYKNICNDLFKLSKELGCAVVISMQANRDTKEMKDDKGVPFPNLYAAEGSDHPARIATQVFAIRQIFETHTLDIRLEKSRMANNQKPLFSYSWDVNTGTMKVVDNGEAQPTNAESMATPTITPSIPGTVTHRDDSKILEDAQDWDETDVEF